MSVHVHVIAGGVCPRISEMGGSLTEIVVAVRLCNDPPSPRQRGSPSAVFEHATALGKRLVFDVILKDERAIRPYEGLRCRRVGGLIIYHYGYGIEEPAAV